MAATGNAKFVKEGATFNVTPSSAVNCGDFVNIIAGSASKGVTGIALWDIPASTPGTVKLLKEGEIVHVTLAEALGAVDAKTALYLVVATGVITTTSTSNTLIGYAAANIGATDTEFDLICA